MRTQELLSEGTYPGPQVFPSPTLYPAQELLSEGTYPGPQVFPSPTLYPAT